MEQKASSLRHPVQLKHQMSQIEAQYNQIEALRAKHRMENIAKKEAIQNEIYATCNIIMEFEEFCKIKGKEVKEYNLKKKSEL